MLQRNNIFSRNQWNTIYQRQFKWRGQMFEMEIFLLLIRKMLDAKVCLINLHPRNRQKKIDKGRIFWQAKININYSEYYLRFLHCLSNQKLKAMNGSELSHILFSLQFSSITFSRVLDYCMERNIFGCSLPFITFHLHWVALNDKIVLIPIQFSIGVCITNWLNFHLRGIKNRIFLRSYWDHLSAFHYRVVTDWNWKVHFQLKISVWFVFTQLTVLLISNSFKLFLFSIYDLLCVFRDLISLSGYGSHKLISWSIVWIVFCYLFFTELYSR